MMFGAQAAGKDAQAAAPTGGVVLPWVEKYRPQKVNDVASQQDVIKTLQGAMESGNLPHLLFYGPPGTGKTSTCLALAKQLFGGEFKRRVLELNASDDRGISIVREKVKRFAQGAVGSKTRSGHACPPFKLIILDEADSLTTAAQDALRRTMEKYSKVTRFCFICNYVSRIIGPLTSRCAKFRFTLLPADTMGQRLRFVAEKERVPITDAIINTLIGISGGDMRKAIQFLQSAHQLYGDSISPQACVEISGEVPRERMAPLWVAVEQGTDFDKVQEEAENLLLDGFSAPDMLEKLCLLVQTSETLQPIHQALICQKIGAADMMLQQGTDESIVLLDVLAYAMRCSSSKNPELPN